MFVKILNAGHKDFLLYRENLKKPIQMQVFPKQNVFSQFVSAYLKCRINFEHL